MQPKHSRKKMLLSAMLSLAVFATSMAAIGLQDNDTYSESQKISKHLYANTMHKQENIAKYGRLLVMTREDDESLHDSADDTEVIYISDKEGMRTECLYDAPEAPTFAGEVQEVTYPESIGPDDEFEVEITVLNTGDIAWFQYGYCENQVAVNLATANEYSRSSVFGTEDYAVYGWLNDSRIQMDEIVVYPEETATFKFTSTAPWGDIWYKEYFVPVAEGMRWMDEATTAVDIKVGVTDDIDAGIMDVVSFSSTNLDFEGLEKWLHADLSDQRMQLMVGDYVIYDIPVSTGAWDTPTPTGTYYILNKQELRIGGEWPHYRMPNWMGFTSVGHGLHALPYLESDGGAFWYEALDHIGTPVSHGCIRQLPDDSEKVYNFGEVDMRLVIER